MGINKKFSMESHKIIMDQKLDQIQDVVNEFEELNEHLQILSKKIEIFHEEKNDLKIKEEVNLQLKIIPHLKLFRYLTDSQVLIHIKLLLTSLLENAIINESIDDLDEERIIGIWSKKKDEMEKKINNIFPIGPKRLEILQNFKRKTDDWEICTRCLFKKSFTDEMFKFKFINGELDNEISDLYDNLDIFFKHFKI